MAKIINLFDGSKVVENTGVKYSELIIKLMDSFKKELKDKDDFEEIVDFTIDAWNFANHQAVLPKEIGKKEIDKVLNGLPFDKADVILLRKMIDYKLKNFNDYPNFIAGFEIDETGKEPFLRVVAEDRDSYFKNLSRAMEELDELEDDDFEDGFINRSAVILKPLQPFFDWLETVYPEDDSQEFKDTKIYLVNDDIENLETWLKKNYDDFFTQELFGYTVDENDWPKKRTYKMFTQWYEVSFSDFVFDMENSHISKV